MERRAGDVGLGLELADQPAARGDLDPGSAGAAAQALLHYLLEAFLADLEARRDEQAVTVLRLIFLAIGRADIADQMADRRAFGIETREGPERRHAGKLRLAQRDRRIFLEGQALGHRHRLEAGSLAELAADPVDLLGRKLEDVGELGDHPLGILELVGDQIDAEVGAVDRHRDVVAIEDPAAPRRQQPHVDAVLLRHRGVALILADRDIAHPARQERRDPPLARAEQEGAPGEGVALGVFGDEGDAAAVHALLTWRGATGRARG